MSTTRSPVPVLAVHLGVALATLLALADLAIAQPSPLASPFSSALGIGGHAGWLKSDDADDPNPYGGAHVRLRLLPILGLEGSADYRREEVDNGAVELRSFRDLDTDGWLATVGATFYFR